MRLITVPYFSLFIKKDRQNDHKICEMLTLHESVQINPCNINFLVILQTTSLSVHPNTAEILLKGCQTPIALCSNLFAYLAFFDWRVSRGSDDSVRQRGPWLLKLSITQSWRVKSLDPFVCSWDRRRSTDLTVSIVLP
jgi:hypothetical protein